ncbi:MAG TPA: CpaF family protein, partial [Afifellaceae bacterium]|nr:CpaF family protein [Afifellaceae bacterium]
MFGKRNEPGRAPQKIVEPMDQPADQPAELPAPEPTTTAPVPVAKAAAKPAAKPEPQVAKKTDEYYDVKTQIFGALIDTIDLSQLAKMDSEQAREEIRDIVNDIITVKNVVLSISEQEELLEDICNDVLGYGPLEPLLARDDIADIMVNGADTTFIEVDGKVQETSVRFRDNGQLLNVCQRIVSQV